MDRAEVEEALCMHGLSTAERWSHLRSRHVAVCARLQETQSRLRVFTDAEEKVGEEWGSMLFCRRKSDHVVLQLANKLPPCIHITYRKRLPSSGGRRWRSSATPSRCFWSCLPASLKRPGAPSSWAWARAPMSPACSAVLARCKGWGGGIDG